MKKRLSKILVTVLCLMSMVALLPTSTNASVTWVNYSALDEFHAQVGVSIDSRTCGFGSNTPSYLPCTLTGQIPSGITYSLETTWIGKDYIFRGSAEPGTVGSYDFNVTDIDPFAPAGRNAKFIVTAGPQTIIQADITRDALDGSFTVTPQSKDGNGDVIDVGAVDPALVALHQPTYTFSSSDPSIATINSTTGEVTLVANGTTTITVNSAATESYTAADPITFVLTVTGFAVDPVTDPPVPQTGDTTSILPSAVVGIAALGLLILLVNRKKKKA